MIKVLFAILVIVRLRAINQVVLESIFRLRKLQVPKKNKKTDKLIEECSKNIDEKEIINLNLNDYDKVRGSCTKYIVLFVVASLIILGISGAFIYFHWYLKKSNTDVISVNPVTETIIY